ncbi:MAG: hypothetical protein Aurels2KO_39950 [Aureliella sp.]
MSTNHRKLYAKRQLDAAAKQTASEFPESQQQFWRLLRVLRAGSTLLHIGNPAGNRYSQNINRILLACSRIAQHSSDWKRAPELWTAPNASRAIQLRSFIQHTFDRYQVPVFMTSVWHRPTTQPWEIELYLHLASGSGIRQSEKPLPLQLGKTAAMHFAHAPHDLVPLAAMRWGHLRSLGADSKLARALTNKSVLAAPTSDEPFWESVVRFLVRNQPIPLDESLRIVQFVQDQKFRPAKEVWGPCRWELGTGDQPLRPKFNLQGRSLRSLRRYMAHWKTQIRSFIELPTLRSSKTWRRSGLSPLTIRHGETTWSIEELLTADELRAEGGIMQHCVGSYVEYCKRHESSIWSMRVYNGDKKIRVLTIEVRPHRRLIHEALGKANQSASTDAMEVLRIWAKQEQLQIQPWI